VIYYDYQILSEEEVIRQVALTFTCFRIKNTERLQSVTNMTFSMLVPAARKLHRSTSWRVATHFPSLLCSALPCSLYYGVNLARIPHPVHKPVPLLLPSSPPPCHN